MKTYSSPVAPNAFAQIITATRRIRVDFAAIRS